MPQTMTQIHNAENDVPMLRCAIALAWADGELEPHEKELLNRYIDRNINLTPEQRAELRAAVENRITLEEAWKSVTDILDRAHLINIAQTIFTQDGQYEPTEKAAYDRMMNEQLAKLDRASVEADLRAMHAQLSSRWEAEEVEEVKSMSRIERIFYYFDNKR